MRHFVHDEVAVLTSNNACAMEFADKLHEAILLKNSQQVQRGNISMTLYVYNEELPNLTNISRMFYRMKMHKTSIIMLLSLKATECVIFRVASALNMASHDITWILLEHKTNCLSKNCLPFQVINIQRNVKIESMTQSLLNGFYDHLKAVLDSGLGFASKSKPITCR